MTTAFAVKTIFEIIAILLVVYGIMHEKKLIKLENMLIRFIARKIYLHRRRKAIERKRMEQRHIRPVPSEKKAISQRRIGARRVA